MPCPGLWNDQPPYSQLPQVFYQWQQHQKQDGLYRHHPEKRIMSNWSHPRSSTSFFVVGRKSVNWNLEGLVVFASFLTAASYLSCRCVGVVFLCCFAGLSIFFLWTQTFLFLNEFLFKYVTCFQEIELYYYSFFMIKGLHCSLLQRLGVLRPTPWRV